MYGSYYRVTVPNYGKPEIFSTFFLTRKGEERIWMPVWWKDII